MLIQKPDHNPSLSYLVLIQIHNMATAAPKTPIATPAALTTAFVGAAAAEEAPVAALLGTLTDEARVAELVEEPVEERAVPVLEPEDVIPVDEAAAPEASTLFTTLDAMAISLLKTLL